MGSPDELANTSRDRREGCCKVPDSEKKAKEAQDANNEELGGERRDSDMAWEDLGLFLKDLLLKRLRIHEESTLLSSPSSQSLQSLEE